MHLHGGWIPLQLREHLFATACFQAWLTQTSSHAEMSWACIKAALKVMPNILLYHN